MAAESVCFCGYEATPEDPCPQCDATTPSRAQEAEYGWPSLVRLRNAQLRLLLSEARDLLWHNPGHVLGGKTDCPGCDLEAEIDAALNESVAP